MSSPFAWQEFQGRGRQSHWSACGDCFRAPAPSWLRVSQRWHPLEARCFEPRQKKKREAEEQQQRFSRSWLANLKPNREKRPAAREVGSVLAIPKGYFDNPSY